MVYLEIQESKCLFKSEFFKVFECQNSKSDEPFQRLDTLQLLFDDLSINTDKRFNLILLNCDAKFFYALVYYVKSFKIFRQNVFSSLCIISKSSGQTFNQNSIVIDFKNFNKLINKIDTQNVNYARLRLNLIAVDLNERCDIIQTWTSIVNSWLNKKIKYDGYTAFFSTLGGAYSSLGEESYEHAKNAEKISKRQLSLAYAFNDPNAICRCKLFLAFSYIQLLKFKEANFILRNEYKYLKDERNKKLITDGKLRVMCVAGLKKLKFVYQNFKIKNAYFSDRGKLRS